MRNKILFIGALKARNKDKSVGGLYTACSTLAEEFENRGIDVVKLNTTYAAKSVSAKIPFHKKVYTLITRALEFIFKILINKKAKNILIFVSAGNSYIDKIPSVFMSRITKKNIMVFPRSGFLLRDFEKKKLTPFIRYVLNSADTIVCQSQFWKDYFVSKGIPENKLVIVENWVIDKVIEAHLSKINFWHKNGPSKPIE